MKTSPQVKFFDTTVAIAAVAVAAPLITDCFSPVQGIGVNQRIGDGVRLLRMHCGVIGQIAGLSANLRVCIFRWHQITSIVPPSFGSIVASAAVATGVVAPYNVQGVEEDYFSIVHDKTYTVGNDRYLALRLNLSMGASPVRFDPALGSGMGKIFVMLMVDATVSVGFVTRLYYTDE